ncbi:MAG TPA: SAV_6107 family HEPN domain-containing protein [Trebonia sp.]
MTMISTLTAAGTPARNALPPTTGPRATGPLSSGSQGTGPLSAGSANTGPAGLGQGTAAAGPLPMPRSVPGAALSLLRTARQGLAEAEAEADAGTRYIGAHLAALRAAAAIVAARGEPGTGARRRRPRSVWELLPQVEPALAEWAAFFAASAAKRAAAEAGLPRAATAREADDLLRDASTFLMVAERALGVEAEPMLPLSLRHAS